MPFFRTRRQRRNVVHQEVRYVPRQRSVYVDRDERPYQVWTLFERDPNKPPAPPIEPQEGVNACLEAFGRDWAWVRCAESGRCFIRYYGDVAPNGGVWILLEYAEP